ncbi:TonB-dependent siderophore receptor [Sphingomonas sp.]|uniref:TonB-dependent siderophore receptor n=1 Tax=Sphingomonas sp. TaxID=28214 RepID=UPI000DB3179F|nr:TonB-dependent siderophore receptor [Sphingomonas sp.]PZU11837.1 MAG: TonB-dependent siderophore receptor [Sphingomonas sp.]
MNFLLALLAGAAPDAGAAVEPRSADDIVVTAQRTEGNGDYTTTVQSTAVRLPLSKRETPQSMSIVTNAQMRDFQLNDVNQLLTTVPGVNVLAVETDRVYYSARGFDIQTFQIDGVGLPFAFQIQTGSIDTAIYDHIEVIRGAPGLLSSTGNPSAVVNFIRKRPTKDLKATFSAQYGSYNNLRLDGDVSAPLTRDGSLRARVVGALVDTDSYLDRYHLRRWTGYGIVEGDIGASTTVSVGYGYQNHKSNAAMWGSIPLYYTDGTRIDLDRSSSTAPDWSSWNVIDRQIFGDVTHQFGGGWIGKVTAVRRAIDERDQLFYVYGNPDRATGLGVYSYPGAFDGPTRNLTLDAYVGGPITLFGRQHDLMFGVNRSAQDYKQYSSYDTSTIGVSVPLSQLLTGSFARPSFPTSYTLSLNQHTKRETAYGLVRLSLADPLKLMLGANVTRATSEGDSYGTPSNYKKSRFLPYAGVTLDLTSNISAYASFTTIFNPQTQVGADRAVLAPIQGKNLEGGVKGEWFGGRLNASAAIFQTRQNNTAEAAGFDTTLGQTIYRGVDAKSEGIELEFGGRLTDEIQATGGYTIMRVRGENDTPVRTFVPRQTARLNITYSPAALSALKLGASLQYQSKIYYVPGTVATTGVPIKLQQSGYALLDLLARYEINDHLMLSANLKNVTNRKYLTSLVVDQGYYGAPRTVLGTVTVKY